MLSIILPAYQERENLALLVPRIAETLGKMGGRGYEIIIVDDYSGDGSGELVSEMASRNPAIRLLKRPGKLGLASAVMDGAAFARGGELLVMDADLSHPPEKITEICAALSRADIVIGSRNLPGGGVSKWPLERRTISLGATLLARLLLGTGVTDPMSGFFALRKGVLMRTRLRVKGYKILLNILADNPGIRVAEVPYVFRDRFAGKTKLGAGELVRYLLDLATLIIS
jgi:dolichol-phosphate mannosyltransferase